MKNLENKNSNIIDHEYCQKWLDDNKEKLINLEKENAALKAENIRLEDEINNLDNGIHKHKDPHWKMFQDIQLHLEQENTALKKQLADIKYLDVKEVTRLFKLFIGDNEIGEESMADDFISEICELAVPEAKTLNEKEVEKIVKTEIFKDDEWNWLNNYYKPRYVKAITAICKLAPPVIDKERIINAIKKYITLDDRLEDIYELIANEIINNKE